MKKVFAKEGSDRFMFGETPNDPMGMAQIADLGQGVVFPPQKAAAMAKFGNWENCDHDPEVMKQIKKLPLHKRK